MGSGWSWSTSLRSSRASEQLRFFEPLQLHLEPADLLEQLSFLGLNLILVLALFDMGGHVTGAIQQLPLALAHVDRMDGLFSGDLMDRLATTDRLHGAPCRELTSVGAAFAHWW